MPVINPVVPPPGPGPQPVPPTDNLCGWLIDTTCVPGWDDVPADVQEVASIQAAELLWMLTGRRFGGCAVTWRPCSPRCTGAGGYRTWPVGLSATGNVGTWMFPFIDAGVWRNCVCPTACSCGARCEVPFPSPVASVTEVKVDGAVIDPSAYRVDVVRGIPYLVRTDGDCWPQCQTMDLDDTEVGTFAVTYVAGEGLSRAGALATGALAGEIAKACQGAECALPDALSSLSRNGVEVTMVDPTEVLQAGYTGVESVDRWIRAVNPAKKAQPSRVWSPDMRTGRFTG